jgi:hypothetical protein
MTPEHLVLLVHGIRDFSRWQIEIRNALVREGFTVEHSNYGRFNLIEFLLPIAFFRRKAIDEVWKQMQFAIAEHPHAERVSVIAHSFGTYIVAKILQRQFNIKFHRIIFCGSVVRFKFPFEQLRDRFDAPILNEVGTADPWPALAESITTGYGSAGTYGFFRPRIIDRFHNDAPHNYFLNAKFCNEYWVKFLREGVTVANECEPKQPPLWVQLITIFKIKSIVVVSTILFMVFMLWQIMVPRPHIFGDFDVFTASDNEPWFTRRSVTFSQFGTSIFGKSEDRVFYGYIN